MSLVAGIVCIAAVTGYSWTAIRFANYPAPWSAPWQVAQVGTRWAIGNAAIRLLVAGGVAVIAAWPYGQGLSVSGSWSNGLGWIPSHLQSSAWSTDLAGFLHGLGWILLPHGPSATSGHLTWLLVAVTAVALVMLGFIFTRLRHLRHEVQTNAESAAMRDTEGATFSALSNEALPDLKFETNIRIAILACYARMERNLAQRGIPRHPEETAIEYARRAIGQAGAPSDPVRSLTALFHLAGFSTQALTPMMRETAITSLRAIDESAL